MYIRAAQKKRKSESAKTFYQYTLVQNTRINNKVKQESILYLGSSELLADQDNRNTVLLALKAKIYKQNTLFPLDISQDLNNLVESYYAKYLLKYTEEAKVQTPATIKKPPVAHRADFQSVDLNSTEVGEVKSFGAEHLSIQVAEQLELEKHLKACGFTDKQAKQAVASIIARAVFSASEWKTAQILEDNSSLCELFGLENLTHKQLYSIADRLYEHKEKLDRLVYNHITHLFNLEDKIVIFDLSNTYFETSKRESRLAKFGRSKEKRSDCPLVVFTALINQEGFLRNSRIYEGNKADAKSLEDMIADLEKNYESKQKTKKPTIVLDAGIATEENLQLIREKGYHYVCVARSQLKNYFLDEGKLVAEKTSQGQQIKLQRVKTEDYQDNWLYVQSEAKKQKEQSIDEKIALSYQENLETIKASLSKPRGIKTVSKVWERIGRAKEKYSRVSAGYELIVEEDKGIVTDLKWKLIPMSKPKSDKNTGVYFIRTSLETASESALWDIYNTIREVESTFRCLKSDLNIRPVHHQKDERIESHIYLTVLAYQLVNSIRYQTKQAGIHDDWQNIVRKASTQTIQNIQLKAEIKEVHIRKPSKPTSSLQEIYKACKAESSLKSRRKYVTYY